MNKIGNEITITDEESKTCLIDGKKFESNRKMIWYVRKTYKLSLEEYIVKVYYNGVRPLCLKTSNPVSFKAHKLGPWFSNYSKNNFPRKPHTKETKEKIKIGCETTSLEKFGVKNVFSTDWCKEKSKNTMLLKYGVDNIMKTKSMKDLFSIIVKSDETIQKTKETNFKKYGEVTYTSTDENKLKSRKYNYDLYYKNWEKYKNQLNQLSITCLGDEKDITSFTPLKFKCNICNFEWVDTLLIPYCSDCEKNFRNCRSKEESSLCKWVDCVYKKGIVTNKRFNVDGKIYETDICIEDKKLIIELHGLFWHSESAGKDRNYHTNKLKALESLGYTVIQIFEDEWLFKTDIVKNKILHKLSLNDSLPKIGARNCVVELIDNITSNNLLEMTHIQGKSNSSYCYGAYFKDELVAVMTFSKPRVNMGNKKSNIDSKEYELVRFSTTNKYRVIGIASKLLSFFVKDKSPDQIISYADKRWSSKNNNVYEKIGFKFIGDTQPNYWYVKKYKREYRFNFTKQKLIKMGYDPLKTEKEIMKELKYDRIWDCGHLKYEWNLPITV